MFTAGPIVACDFLRRSRLHPAAPPCKAIARRRRSRFQNYFGTLQRAFMTASPALPKKSAVIAKAKSTAGLDEIDPRTRIN
jgi:hypothetical protein